MVFDFITISIHNYTTGLISKTTALIGVPLHVSVFFPIRFADYFRGTGLRSCLGAAVMTTQPTLNSILERDRNIFSRLTTVEWESPAWNWKTNNETRVRSAHAKTTHSLSIDVCFAVISTTTQNVIQGERSGEIPDKIAILFYSFRSEVSHAISTKGEQFNIDILCFSRCLRRLHI
jgi:hypothetical protein